MLPSTKSNQKMSSIRKYHQHSSSEIGNKVTVKIEIIPVLMHERL